MKKTEDADQIIISEFEVNCSVGCTSKERRRRQKIVLDIHLYTPLSKAGETDNITNTIDYQSVIEALKELITSRSFSLIETIAEHAAKMLLAKFPINHAEIRITKRPFKNPKSVAVQISRTQRNPPSPSKTVNI